MQLSESCIQPVKLDIKVAGRGCCSDTSCTFCYFSCLSDFCARCNQATVAFLRLFSSTFIFSILEVAHCWKSWFNIAFLTLGCQRSLRKQRDKSTERRWWHRGPSLAKELYAQPFPHKNRHLSIWTWAYDTIRSHRWSDIVHTSLSQCGFAVQPSKIR